MHRLLSKIIRWRNIYIAALCCEISFEKRCQDFVSRSVYFLCENDLVIKIFGKKLNTKLNYFQKIKAHSWPFQENGSQFLYGRNKLGEK